MSEIDTGNFMKRSRVRLTWQLGLLYAKPVSYIKEKIQDIHKLIGRISLETTMFQYFIDVNQLDGTIDCSVSITDWTSEGSGNSVHQAGNSTVFMKMPGKRTKKRDLSLEHKLSIAHHYLRSITERYGIRKRQAHAHFNGLLAADENLEWRWKTIQSEINWLISKLGPTVCIPYMKPKDLRGRGNLSSAKWRASIVYTNHTNRDGLIRATKLENVSLLEQIKNVEVICKYEEKVDVAEFLRKMLEKCSFPAEIKQLAHKRGKLQCHAEAVERKAHNLRRTLEKEITHGEGLRGRIDREKKTIHKIERSLSMSTAAKDKEQAKNKKLTELLEDYQGPEVQEYIFLCGQDVELNKIVKVWRHKVAAAKIVMDMNQQKWNRLSRR